MRAADLAGGVQALLAQGLELATVLQGTAATSAPDRA